jgi:hypothetical protein
MFSASVSLLLLANTDFKHSRWRRQCDRTWTSHGATEHRPNICMRKWTRNVKISRIWDIDFEASMYSCRKPGFVFHSKHYTLVFACSTVTLTPCLPSPDFSAELPLPLRDALFEVSGYNHSFGLCLLSETTERPMFPLELGTYTLEFTCRGRLAN